MKKKKIGEIKPCSQCGQDYEHFPCNRYEACKECRTKIYNGRGRLKEEDKKKPYPLDWNARKRRYTQLRQRLEKLKTREETRAYFNELLIEIEEMGIMKWCTDLRPSPTPKNKMGKGRLTNASKDPKLKYPNTRGIYE